MNTQQKLIEKYKEFSAYLVKELLKFKSVKFSKIEDYQCEIHKLESALKEPDKRMSADEIASQQVSAYLKGHGDPAQDLHKRFVKSMIKYASQGENKASIPDNGKSESALNAYAKKVGEIPTKPSGVAMGWRACYEWILLNSGVEKENEGREGAENKDKDTFQGSDVS